MKGEIYYIAYIMNRKKCMVRIALFCFAGMSTSVLVKRMRDYALERNIDCSVDAFSQTEVADKVQNLDIVLVGPQIKYLKKRIEEICEPYGVKVMVISDIDFGRMDAKKVLSEAYSLLGKSV